MELYGREKEFYGKQFHSWFKGSKYRVFFMGEANFKYSHKDQNDPTELTILSHKTVLWVQKKVQKIK